MDRTSGTLQTSRPTRRQAILICAHALITALACAGVCMAAVVAHAPAAVAPIVAVCCIGCPLLAARDVPAALSALREATQARALARLRRSLDQLPEIEHPLGL